MCPMAQSVPKHRARPSGRVCCFQDRANDLTFIPPPGEIVWSGTTTNKETDHARRNHRAASSYRLSASAPIDPPPPGLLLPPSLRPHVARVEPVVPLRSRRRPPALRRRQDIGLREHRRPGTGTDLIRVHHDGRDRGEGGCTPLAASDRAVAGRAWVVPVRPLGHPRDHSAFYGRCTGSPGLVRGVGCAIHAVPVRGGYPHLSFCRRTCV